jgi:hypothetical protein
LTKTPASGVSPRSVTFTVRVIVGDFAVGHATAPRHDQFVDQRHTLLHEPL